MKFINGKPTNTEEDNKFIEKWLNKQQKIKVRIDETDEEFLLPLADTISDYTWQLNCLKDREQHPEKYSDFENVEEVKARLRQWIFEQKIA